MLNNSYVEIDLDILKNNALNIMNKYNEYEWKIAMLKGDAYGHGEYVVNTLLEAGFNYFAVSSLEEAIDIRKFNKIVNILCVEPIDLKYIDMIVENNITLSVHNTYYLKKLSETNKGVKVHFLVDSGINRLGISTKEEFLEAYSLLNENIYLEGLFSHFSTAGITDKRWDNQVNRFKEIVSSIDISKIKIVHFASSFSLVNHPKIDICNGYRIGSLLFGIKTFLNYDDSFKSKLRILRNKYYQKKYNLSQTYNKSDLEVGTCMSLYSKVIEVKNVKSGEYIGYDFEYKTDADIKIAIVDIGYEDGIGRINKNRKVIINEKYYSIIGEVSMCMLIVKVDEEVNVGDRVRVIGKGLPFKQICYNKGETVQEVFLTIGNLLPRKYIKDNNTVYEEV